MYKLKCIIFTGSFVLCVGGLYTESKVLCDVLSHGRSIYARLGREIVEDGCQQFLCQLHFHHTKLVKPNNIGMKLFDCMTV